MINWISVGLRLLARLNKHLLRTVSLIVCLVINRCNFNDFIIFITNLWVVFFACFVSAHCFAYEGQTGAAVCSFSARQMKPNRQQQRSLKRVNTIEFTTSDSNKSLKTGKLLCCCTYVSIGSFCSIIILYGFNRMHSNSRLGDIWDLSVTWLTKCAISCQNGLLFVTDKLVTRFSLMLEQHPSLCSLLNNLHYLRPDRSRCTAGLGLQRW